jgi:hypothetical protein
MSMVASRAHSDMTAKGVRMLQLAPEANKAPTSRQDLVTGTDRVQNEDLVPDLLPIGCRLNPTNVTPGKALMLKTTLRRRVHPTLIRRNRNRRAAMSEVHVPR